MSFLEFFELNNIHCILGIFVSIINAIILVLLSKKFLQILQLSNYHIKGYFIWLKDTKAKYISKITFLSFLSLACVLVINFLFDVYNGEQLYSYFGIFFYIFFTYILISNAYKTPQKTPLVQTRRMARLITLVFLISFAITFIFIWIATALTPFLRYGIIVLTPLLLPLIIPFAHFILLPLEALIRECYIFRAKRKLAKMPNLTRIGITGSYGKTSIKYILNKILSEKYNVCMSPHSFNTPMGLTKVVLNYLKKDNQILIAEMGAKQVGDIEYLCKLIKPQHAVITGIGSQHYETFGSEENIIKAKNELVLALPENANVVFNCDSEKTKTLYTNCALKNKYSISLDDNSEVKAESIKFSPEGIEFTLIYGEKKVNCQTVLLGKHNLQNILLASCLALKLGITLEQIKTAVSTLGYISHRLEPIEKGNLIILDDAYSSNEEGAKMALDVLGLYNNRIKICITPGIVELGKKENEVNQQFGENLGNTCNYVIVVNKINEASLKAGLEKSNIKKENVFYVEDLIIAQNKLAELITSEEKYVILFGNDLPDNYK